MIIERLLLNAIYTASLCLSESAMPRFFRTCSRIAEISIFLGGIAKSLPILSAVSFSKTKLLVLYIRPSFDTISPFKIILSITESISAVLTSISVEGSASFSISAVVCTKVLSSIKRWPLSCFCVSSAVITAPRIRIGELSGVLPFLTIASTRLKPKPGILQSS